MSKTKKIKLKLIDPEMCASWREKAPEYVIEFVPVIKHNVGIGWVQEGGAELEDFKKYPVVKRPWFNLAQFMETGL
jgi:hypothetical protein